MKKIVLLLLPIFFLPVLVFAEIYHPYVVDEKSRVLFGDSLPIEVPNLDHTATTTYYGLENYEQNYVNGFAHFSFTYTHAQGSFPSYPPIVYLTAFDPRSTTTPDEKLFYSMPDAPSLYWYGGTGWYLVDIQFDQAGFRASIKQSGENEIYNAHIDLPELANSDWVALANRYRRDAISGQDTNEYAFSFTPVLVKQNSGINPVIIIPGIMGSAKKNGELVIDPILHTYDDLIATLEANGYQKDKNLFTFPYEWRDSNVLSANLLKAKIAAVKNACENAKINNEISNTLGEANCSKVDLIAHSMGGLVAREYVQSGQYDHDVDQLIFLGTPHRGSPKAYLQWEAGEFPVGTTDFLTKKFFELEAFKNGYFSLFDYIQNRPIASVRELLPTFDYLKEKETGILRTYPTDYPRNTFLEYLNSDIAKLLNSGVKIVNITGNAGLESTIDKIRVVKSSSSTWTHGVPDGFNGTTPDRGLENGQGDGTVTVYGNYIDASIGNREIDSNHQRLPTLAAGEVFKILTKKDVGQVFDSGYGADIKVLLLQLKSPIDVVITAPDGKRVGKNFATNGEYGEIAGAFYSGFNNGDEEYITIPNPLDGEYKIEVQGTGSGGEYGVVTSYLSEATSTTDQMAGFTKPDQITEIKVVVNNQGQTVTPAEKAVTLDVLRNDVSGAYDLGWIKDKKVRELLIKQAERIIKLEKRIDRIIEKLPNGSKRERRVEKIETKIDKVLARLLSKELELWLKKDKINQEAYNLIKQDLEYLINNN